MAIKKKLGTAKKTKKVVKKLGSEKVNAGYFFEVRVNDEVYRGDAENLTQALQDFTVSSAFPFAVKTRTIIRYGTETVERQRVLHVPAARRFFTIISRKPDSLELWASKFTKDLA